MADLLVRGVDDELVRALKERAERTAAARRPSTGQSWLPRLLAPASAALLRFLHRCRMPAMTQTLRGRKSTRKRPVYLIDTNVVSEVRKKEKANPGVAGFFEDVAASGVPVYLSSISVGEFRRGIELIRRRGEAEHAKALEAWLTTVLEQFGENILPFDAEAAQVWGRLRVPDPAHGIDKQIAAIALVNDLTVVTRNTADFTGTGVRLKNPFT